MMTCLFMVCLIHLMDIVSKREANDHSNKDEQEFSHVNECGRNESHIESSRTGNTNAVEEFDPQDNRIIGCNQSQVM